jgi:hypothetical protein
MFLQAEDIKTHLYGEIVEAISRDDEDILLASMDAAISEAKGYLADYNKEEIFAKSGEDRHPLLLVFLKDIAVWHFLNLSNPSSDMELRKTRYERAIDWLKGVQKGNITPDLPVVEPAEQQTGSIRFGSNPPRSNQF